MFGGLWLAITRSSGWERVKAQFFNWDAIRDSFPAIAEAFQVNIKIFLIAEAIVLVAALGLAVVRSLPGPFFFPFRLLATAYSDFFRGVPAIVLILWLGLGLPALGDGVPKSTFLWTIVSLSLVYTAYVSEVYRAGINSVHPSQDAAARSLGLTRLQSMRHVVLPQAIRRMVPPLLNDFIGLQKDTALIAIIGVPVEALTQTQIESSATFDFSHYIGVAVLFLLVTIPLTRLVDWLLARDRRRQLSGGGVL